jgi:hypothetical protein
MATVRILSIEKESSFQSHSGLGHHLEGKDREIRTNGLTEMAVDASILSFRLRVIITFEIEGLGHPENIAGAVIDTELTALASIFNDGDPTLCDLNGLQIKWNSPIFHLNSLSFESLSKDPPPSLQGGRVRERVISLYLLILYQIEII